MQNTSRDKQKIVSLMRVAEQEHDVNWLMASLQAAIELEFSTVPPYLAAEWSIKSSITPTARSIHEIVREEMLHLGLACNLLAAIGGHPRLNEADVVPIYPGPLPGGVHPGLIVPLQRLSKDAAKVFMDIELPELGPIALIAGETFPTIGAFYTAIQKAFDTLQPVLTLDNQIEGPLGLGTITTLDAVRDAISLIKHQGEGSADSPEDTGPGDLAHYYRFGEIYHGHHLRKDAATGKWQFDGDEIPPVEVWPSATIPEGGYRKENVPDAAVWEKIDAFDRTYTNMLNQLQAAWNTGDSGQLGAAVGTMIQMRTQGVALMQIAIPESNENYGPCFRLVA